MTITISASVGKNGTNNRSDVKTIQQALNKIPPAQGAPNPNLNEDGLIGPKTISAITVFQDHHGLPADGRIDPNGQTIAKINSLLAGEPGSSIFINFGPNAKQDVVSEYTRGVLKDILAAANLTSALITSTARTPEDQARIMFNNIEAKGVEHQKNLYGPFGDKVIDVYVAEKAAGKTEAQVKAAMVAKIYALGPSNVSKHLADPDLMNVIDIAPSSIANKPAFESAVQAEVTNERISKFLTPDDNDPAYHLEIPQPANE